MDVSLKLHRLFLPIVIIGALGIGIIDSVLTPSPVLADSHELCVDDPREFTAYPCDAESVDDWWWLLIIFSFLGAISLYNIRDVFKQHPVRMKRKSHPCIECGSRNTYYRSTHLGFRCRKCGLEWEDDEYEFTGWRWSMGGLPSPTVSLRSNPWNLPAVLWLGANIAMLCMFGFGIVVTLQG